MAESEGFDDGIEGSTSDEDSKNSGPLDTLLPPSQAILNEARRLLADNNTRADNLATMCMQDPVILIELIKKANALYFSGGRNPITTAKTAIVRLGSEVVAEVLEELTRREAVTEPSFKKYMEIYRSRSRRIGIVTRIVSEAVNKGLSEDCQTIGSLFSIGDMLAVHHFGETYVELAEEQSRTSVNYKLSANHKFDPEKMGLNYLRRAGIPEVLVFAMDREGRPRTTDNALMKPICWASAELVDAFDNEKWEKLAPGKNLAPKSALRMLQMNDNQYLKIYERTAEYLFTARMLEEKQRQASEPVEEEIEEIEEAPRHDNELQNEIENLLGGDEEEEPEPEVEEIEEETDITETNEDLGEIGKDFALSKKKTSKKVRETKPKTKSKSKPAFEAPFLRSKGNNKFVDSVGSVFENAASSEELLANLLQVLVDGPFEKAALIVISQNRKQAIVVAARGPIGNGQKIEIKDPLSPLAQCFAKVQSFSSKPNEASPFGSKSFAVAPIDADHDTPVALYADCGANGAITFEARRIFRTVVETLNQKLPTIPGGIPVELST